MTRRAKLWRIFIAGSILALIFGFWLSSRYNIVISQRMVGKAGIAVYFFYTVFALAIVWQFTRILGKETQK